MNFWYKLKIITFYIIAFVLIYYVVYQLSYTVLTYVFVNIFNECTIDSYGIDCFAPVTKSAFIALIISVIISTLLTYIFWARLFSRLMGTKSVGLGNKR